MIAMRASSCGRKVRVPSIRSTSQVLPATVAIPTWHDRGMVLLAELLLVAGILYGGYRRATTPPGRMSVVEPDRSPATRDEGSLTADALVAMHLPMGFGYRKVDVDRLLDRVAQQLPRATYQPAADVEDATAAEKESVSLSKDEARPAPAAGVAPAAGEASAAVTAPASTLPTGSAHG